MITERPAIVSPTLHTAALAGVEALVNRALALDPATQNRLASLAGHVFLIHCTAPSLSIYLIPETTTVRLCGAGDGEADTTLTGSAREFAKLVTATDPASALINGEVVLHGNSQALIELQKIIRQLDIDWEAPLADLFGDVIGHQLGVSIRSGIRFGLQLTQSLKRQLDDYLIEESNLLAPQWRADKFFDEVDQLAMRTERLQARLNKYRQQLASTASKPNAPKSP